MGRTVVCPRRCFAAVRYRLGLRVARPDVLVLFACSPLTVTAITPLAARGTRTSSCVTTGSATLCTGLQRRGFCHRSLRRGFCWGLPRVVGRVTAPSRVGGTPRPCG